MKILIIDNYDSFTYNIVESLRQIGQDCDVIRNDKIDIEQVEQYDKIIVSPGPGIPSEAGLLPQILQRYATTKSILGICLGHQAIAENFGATLINMKNVMHGVRTPIKIISDDYIFSGMSKTLEVGRYHSWVVDSNNLPDSIIVTSIAEDGEIMSIRHKDYDVHGVQFHPESILTPDGLYILYNYVNHK